jgi:hypothetical protein
MDPGRQQELGRESCPLQGLHAPELAAGDFKAVLVSSTALELNYLACEFRLLLQPDEPGPW